VIPGFLTEPHSLIQSDTNAVLSQVDPTAILDRRGWHTAAKMCCHEQVEVITYQWASQSAINLLAQTLGRLLPNIRRPSNLNLHLVKVAKDIYQAWYNAIKECDAKVQELSTYYQELGTQGEVYVLGHSLGARLAIKALDHLSTHTTDNLPKVSGWAPALNADDADWMSLDQLMNPPEILFSEYDLVLKMIYPLGQDAHLTTPIHQLINIVTTTLKQDERKKAVGLIGPPQECYSLLEIALNLNEKKMSHLGYLPCSDYLFKKSTYLSSLRTDQSL
jgi:hypothetical protein